MSGVNEIQTILFQAAALRVERLSLRHVGASDRTDGPSGVSKEEEMGTMR